MSLLARTTFVALCVAILLGRGGVTPASAQTDDDCAIYAAALRRIVPDSMATMVAYDSVSLALPGFAFHAWTGMGLPKAGSPVPLTDSLWQRMRGTYAQREALPECFGAGRRVVRVPYDSLIAQFKDKAKGWDQFRAVFPSARGFFIAGRPFFVDDDHTQAFLYLAQATDWLSGWGQMAFLRKVDGRREVIGTHAMWES